MFHQVPSHCQLEINVSDEKRPPQSVARVKRTEVPNLVPIGFDFAGEDLSSAQSEDSLQGF